MRISVCIPTHERHTLLETCLRSLLRQTRPPDEVVIADSSTGDGVSQFARHWQESFRPIKFVYMRTQEPSLISNRWEAFSQSSGELVFFVDDDIRLEAEAIAQVCSTFEAHPAVVGVGVKIYYDGPAPPHSRSRELRQWWLGNNSTAIHSISDGGRSIVGKTRVDARPIPVQWLPGGGMCFRREALAAVGPLPGIDGLFRLRIGKSSDAVLSGQVGLNGQLVLLTEPFAWHPERRTAKSTAVSLDAWRRGLVDTVGKAHVLRWLARDQSKVAYEWVRLVSLSLLQTAKAVLRSPFSTAPWQRLVGLLYGGALTILIWRRIPKTPDTPLQLNRKWLFI